MAVNSNNAANLKFRFADLGSFMGHANRGQKLPPTTRCQLPEYINSTLQALDQCLKLHGCISPKGEDLNLVFSWQGVEEERKLISILVQSKGPGCKHLAPQNQPTNFASLFSAKRFMTQTLMIAHRLKSSPACFFNLRLN